MGIWIVVRFVLMAVRSFDFWFEIILCYICSYVILHIGTAHNGRRSFFAPFILLRGGDDMDIYEIFIFMILFIAVILAIKL